jgi:hypothetical protein
MSSWVEKPENLISRLNVLPSPGDSFGEKLNALSRLLIVSVIVLVLLKWKYWHIVLAVGIFLIIFFYLLKSEADIVEHFNEDMNDPKHYDTKCPCRKGQVSSPPVTYVPFPSQTVSAPLEDLYTYVRCEPELQVPVEPVKVVEKEEPKPYISKIRRPKTGVVIKRSERTKERTAYENLQDSYDFVRKNEPNHTDYSSIVNIL